MTAAPPPDPFEPDEEVLPAGHRVYRVASDSRPVTSFNPGIGDRTRFAFFGRTDSAEREESISAFLGRHGYSRVADPVSSPPASIGIRFEPVDEAFGMPAPGADTVDSTQAEVDRVVDLVIQHALATPDRSLAVIAFNARHADLVREAVFSAISDTSDVAAFFTTDKDEPFVVVDTDGSGDLRRDTVILSLGYAKTPHGRVLHSFGAVSGPGGAPRIVDAINAVRENLVLVSSLGPGDIDRDRLDQRGPLLLADLIDWAARPPLVQPLVPVLYAADTEESALAESLLHDIPISGGYLGPDDYVPKVMGRLTITRDIRLASLRGLGLRRLGVADTQVTNTDATEYGTTVEWAKAAHAAGFEGLSWTSRLCNDARAIVLFGDRAGDAVEQDPTFGRHFRSGDGLDWLITTCAPLRVMVLPPH